MDNNYTHLVLVVDRSGSMGATREEAQGGINSFLKKQKEVGGKCTLSIYEFDHEISKVCSCVDVSTIENEYNLIPRGYTALYDAVGISLRDTCNFVDSLDEDFKPGTVIVCIVTDGFENHSREYNLDKVKSLVENCKSRKWDVTFLGSDLSTQEQAKSMGFSQDVVLQYNAAKTGQTYDCFSEKVSGLRSMKMQGVEASLKYDDNDKKSVE